MREIESRLLRDRTERKRARARLDQGISAVRSDLESRGVGERATELVLDEARQAGKLGLDVAREAKGVVAGTVGALLLWQFRAPIMRGIRKLLSRLGDRETLDESPGGDWDSE